MFELTLVSEKTLRDITFENYRLEKIIRLYSFYNKM